jgi:glycosyltransferase involved in cell wall biosynthesis
MEDRNLAGNINHELGYIVHLKTPGEIGGETRSYQVAQALGSIGAQIFLYGDIAEGVKWHSNVHPCKLKHPAPLGIWQLLCDFQLNGIKVCIERYQFPPFNVGWWTQSINNQPILLEVHGFPIDEYSLAIRENPQESGPFRRLFAKVPKSSWELMQEALFRRVDHFIVTSRGTMNILVNSGVPANKISTVYNGVDPVMFSPSDIQSTDLRTRLGLPTDRQIILYGGSLFHEELLTVFEAIPAVVSVHPKAHFAFIGRGPTDHLLGRVNELGLTDKQISILPAISHKLMPALLSSVDLLLAPYKLDSKRFEKGFHYSPLKILEALAMQKVIVTVNSKELIDVFGGLPNLFYVQNGSAASWSETILIALEQHGNSRLVEGREFVLDGFSWKRVAEKYIQILSQVISGKM